jgi:hypothetical protein
MLLLPLLPPPVLPLRNTDRGPVVDDIDERRPAAAGVLGALGLALPPPLLAKNGGNDVASTDGSGGDGLSTNIMPLLSVLSLEIDDAMGVMTVEVAFDVTSGADASLTSDDGVNIDPAAGITPLLPLLSADIGV